MIILFLPFAALISCGHAYSITHNADNKTLFKVIYQQNSWLNKNTRSGNGSDLTETPIVRLQIPQLIKKYGIKTMLDAGCGEFFWQKELDFSGIESYIGIDIVPEIIEHNQTKYPAARRSFMVLDMVEQDIPQVDLILCRDVLQHLSDDDVKQIIANMKKSGSTYLLASTFPHKQKNEDPAKQENAIQWRVTGKGRNLRIKPFNFPEPIEVIIEGFENKTLGLWKIADLPDYQVAPILPKAPNKEHLSLLEE